MYEELEGKNTCAGLKQVIRACERGLASKMYIATDAESYIQIKLEKAAEAYNVPIVRVRTMQELGNLFKLPVKTAAGALLK